MLADLIRSWPAWLRWGVVIAAYIAGVVMFGLLARWIDKHIR